MKASRLCFVIALLAVMAACGGGSGDAQLLAPASDEEEVFSPADNASNPFILPSGDESAIPEDELGADGDEGAADAPERETGGGEGRGAGKAPPITCFQRDLNEAQTGAPYAATLKAAGGSGNLRYALKGNDELPRGLELAGDGKISGTPEVATGASGYVLVKDEAGKQKSCRFKIVIHGEIELKANRIDGKGNDNPWDAVYEVKAMGGVDHVAWELTGDSQNVCMSEAKPNISTEDFRRGCSLPGLSGDTVYIWIKEDERSASELKVTLTASSEFSPHSASAAFRFTSTRCGDGVKQALETCDGRDGVGEGSECSADCKRIITPPKKAESVELEVSTGPFENAGTDCNVHLAFFTGVDESGKRLGQNNVSFPVFKKEHLEPGERDTIVWHLASTGFAQKPRGIERAPVSNLTEEHRYFTLQVRGNSCEAPGTWFLQGMKVTVRYEGNAKPYIYYNPCIEKWLFAGDILQFGPNDTAVCATVRTSTTGHSGTNDRIQLVLPAPRDFELAQPEHGASSSMSKIKDGDVLRMDLRLGGFDLFEEGSVATFGDYIFDRNPFPEAPVITIEKADDGHQGEWNMHSYEVFLFRPGRFYNGDAEALTVEHVSEDLSLHPKKFGDEELTYTMPAMSKRPANVIHNGIGARFYGNPRQRAAVFKG